MCSSVRLFFLLLLLLFSFVLSRWYISKFRSRNCLNTRWNYNLC